MIEKYSRYKILQEFMKFPLKDFHMRELSRRVKIAQPSVLNHLKELAKQELIIKEKKSIYPTYRANTENLFYKEYKKFNLIMELNKNGLLDHIENSCQPDSIILFGSASKGEDIEESDIDFFVQGPDKNLNFSKYEKFLNREINVFYEEDFSKLNKELKNNILNGILLRGYLKVF